MGVQDLLLLIGTVVLAANGRRLAEFWRRLGGSISNRRSGGLGGPTAAWFTVEQALQRTLDCFVPRAVCYR